MKFTYIVWEISETEQGWAVRLRPKRPEGESRMLVSSLDDTTLRHLKARPPWRIGQEVSVSFAQIPA